MIQIEPLIGHLDEGTRYAQLASWAVAGLHCSTRAEKETYDFYVRYMSEGQSLDLEELSLEMRIALSLADLRKNLVSELVPQDEIERLHQVAYLEKKAGTLLALVGDADAFQDRHEIIVKTAYKNLSPADILTHAQSHYTVDRMANFLAESLNRGTRLSYTHLAQAFKERQSSINIAEFYNEDLTAFTPQGAKALLYSTGYLEGEAGERNSQVEIKEKAAGQEENPLRHLMNAAEQGEAKAQYNLGMRYHKGKGVAKDYTEAAKWVRRAADQRYAQAQYMLGAFYFHGQGLTKDYIEAAKWFRKAADQGYAQAQNALGAFYLHGQGVAKDYTEAAKWFRKAADQGYAQAQYMLGFYYYGCYQNYKSSQRVQDGREAVKWFRKAADQGHDQAQYMLGQCYNWGEGVSHDKREAAKWYHKAAAQGHASAKRCLRPTLWG